uniref:Uncharacterized protein n=1 Tax=Zooxanthella nutricula TaxID=1333877 RepID=A0A7S2KEL8_9DINO
MRRAGRAAALSVAAVAAAAAGLLCGAVGPAWVPIKSTLRAPVEILGICRGRLVVGYEYSIDTVGVSANGTKLKQIKTLNWRQRDSMFGDRGCKYAEFDIPDLPAEISAFGLVMRQVVSRAEPRLIEDDEVSDAAAWNTKYMVRPSRQPAVRKKDVFGRNKYWLLQLAKRKRWTSELETDKAPRQR